MGFEPLRVWAGDLDGIDVSERWARLDVHPVVRAHLDDRHGAPVRADRYGCLLTDYRLTDLAEAEVALLPMAFESTDRADLHRRLALAERHGLRTVAFSNFDAEPMLPAESMVLLHPGPTRGAQQRGVALAIPYGFTDRAGGDLDRPSTPRPSVAFCGQGAARPGAAALQAAQRGLAAARNLRTPQTAGLRRRGHVALRARALRGLHDDDRVDDRFLIRTRYRAGAVSESARDRTQAEFDDNLRSADYTLCVRGLGNFSARFYEALSFGRVPLFVDTRCVLPFEDEIDWRQHCVWVDETEVGQIAERLVEAHAEPDPQGARSAGSLRRLWEERLTQAGFYRHFVATVRSWGPPT